MGERCRWALKSAQVVTGNSNYGKLIYAALRGMKDRRVVRCLKQGGPPGKVCVDRSVASHVRVRLTSSAGSVANGATKVRSYRRRTYALSAFFPPI
jgi:hypothetical protein